MAKTLRAQLKAVFDADQALRKAESGLLKSNSKELRTLLARAVAEAEKLSDASQACMQLERLADLCAQAPGSETLDALMRLLDHDDPSVRIQACEALVDVGCDRPRPFSAAVKRALKRKQASPALEQLPWIIAEIGEPDAEQLIKPFLGYESAAIAGAAVEALISLATPEAFAAIEPFKDDSRLIDLDDDDCCGHGGPTITIGQLVRSFLSTPRAS